MNLRLASHNLAALLHRSTHLRSTHVRSTPVRPHRRSHEGIFRVIQLVVMVVVALFCAKLLASGVILAMRALSGFMS